MSKKIIKLLILSIFIISVSSCDNEDQDLLTASVKGSGEITAPQTGTAYILNPEETQTNTILTLTWNPADFGVPTEIDYTVEFAKTGTNFETPIITGLTTNTFLSWTTGEFNSAVSGSGLSPFIEGSLDIRVIATIGAGGSTPQTSEAIAVLVTPFTTDLPTIAVPGNHQGVWDPATAPLLASSTFGATDYEGYLWLDGEYKFIAPNEILEFHWGNTDWGDDGTFTGILVETDEVNCNATTAGYYFVKADTGELTYSATTANWGVIGNATPPGNWELDTDMIYDPETKTLSVTLDLTAQSAPDNGFKFRVNDDWALNLGDTGADGTLEPSGTNIGVPVAGNYTIILDLSTPREYTYSLTLN